MAQESLFSQEFLSKLEYLYLVIKKLLIGNAKAERRSRKIGSGIEFADYREYVPGDDPRHIDWTLYARLEKLFLRLFEEEEDLYVYVLVDISASMRMGSPSRLHYASKVAAALAYITLNNLDRVSVLTFGDKLIGRMPPNRGKKNIMKVLHFLSTLPEAKLTDTKTSLRTFVHQTKRRGVAIVISDFYDEAGYVQAMNYLRYHKYDIYAIQLYDEKELEPSLRGDVELVDHETGQILPATLSPRLVKAYREAFEQFCTDLEEYCRKSEISLFRTSVQVPFEDLILDIFRRRGFLK